jgi:hypothetical protein
MLKAGSDPLKSQTMVRITHDQINVIIRVGNELSSDSVRPEWIKFSIDTYGSLLDHKGKAISPYIGEIQVQSEPRKKLYSIDLDAMFFSEVTDIQNTDDFFHNPVSISASQHANCGTLQSAYNLGPMLKVTSNESGARASYNMVTLVENKVSTSCFTSSDPYPLRDIDNIVKLKNKLRSK